MTNLEPICQPHIDSAGLPWRTPALLERERHAYAAMANTLTQGPLTVALLKQALGSAEPGAAYAAAFLAGRCAAVDAGLTGVLADLAAGASEPDVAIEAAMALALRGDPARGKAMLEARLHAVGPLDDQYKAAFYLAQLGDPSGYGALLATLHSDIPHYRLMALRHALAFQPYQGRMVGNLQVDVAALLAERLADSDELVRSEVPFYLEELAPPDLRARLEQVEQADPSPSVRIAARMVLDRIA